LKHCIVLKYREKFSRAYSHIVVKYQKDILSRNGFENAEKMFYRNSTKAWTAL